jgi:hypothetical protein
MKPAPAARPTAALLAVLASTPVAANGGPPASVSPHDQACGAAYVEAQVLRRQSRLRAARESLLVCSNTPCPTSVRGDCARWLGEVEAALPTVVFSMKGPKGEDLSAVKVEMDGAALLDSIGGASVPVDPGRHTFRFEPEGGAPVDAEVLINEGEKDRIVRAQVTPAASGARSTPLAVPLAIGAGAIVLGGLGAYFEIVGLSNRSSADTCAQEASASPPCAYATTYAPHQSAAQRDFLAGDILVGASLLAVGAAVFLFVSGRPRDTAQSGLALVASPLGGSGLQLRF